MKLPSSLIALAISTTVSGVTYAHGTLDFPISRILQCQQEGAESPTSAACIAAKALGGSQPFYDYAAISQNAGGNDKAFVPDGQLCSGGNTKYQGIDLARNDWKKTAINTSGNINFSFHGTAPHATKRWNFYITKDSYDMSQPLRWDNLEKFCEHGDVALDGNRRYNMACTIPDGFNGDRIIYNVWERSDSQETFYTCSDVTISGLAEGSDTDNGNTDTSILNKAHIQSPLAGSTLGSAATFNVNLEDSSTTWLYLGSAPGQSDYSRTAVSETQMAITDIPQNGQAVYVTVYSYLNNQWETNSYQYLSGSTTNNTDNNQDSAVNLGTIQAENDLIEGTVVTLRLMDTNNVAGNMSDLETHQITIEENMGSKDNWVWHLAKQVNQDSQYIRIGQMAQDDGGIDTVIAIRQAKGNTIYSIASSDLHVEIETKVTKKEDNNNDIIDLITSASAISVSGTTSITVSGLQSSGIDLQNAQFTWSVVDGVAKIISPNALETQVTFNETDAGQNVTLLLIVNNNGEIFERSMVISHTTAKPKLVQAVEEAASGSNSIILVILLSCMNFLRLARKEQ